MDNSLAQRMKAYIEAHPFDPGDSDYETVLDQLYQGYAESHESDPPEIGDGFKELEEFLHTLPLADNNAVFNLCLPSLHCLRTQGFLGWATIWGTFNGRTQKGNIENGASKAGAPFSLSAITCKLKRND